jgi:hypothetical protein
MLRNRESAALVTLITLAGLSAACDTATDADAGDDVVLAESAATADDTNSQLIYLASYFTIDARTPGSALAAVEAALKADLALPECLTVDTDGASYIELVFSDCRGAGGHLRLDGALRAELALTANAVGFALTATELEINQTTVSGSWQVEAPLALGGTTTWQGTTSIAGPLRDIKTTTSASWTVTGACVTYSYRGELDRMVGKDTVTGTDITRCMDVCPRSGRVELTHARGTSLAWSYNGDGTATVVGERGSFDIVLPCAL